MAIISEAEGHPPNIEEAETIDELAVHQVMTWVTPAAMQILRRDEPRDWLTAIERELRKVEQERARLVSAIAVGGQLEGLLQALRRAKHGG